MIEIAQCYKIPTIEYKLADLEILDLDELEKIIKNDNELTHLMLVHHETTTGMLEPLKQICTMARRYNLITIVDTISSIGAHPFSLEELDVDFCTLSANKAAEGLPGISFVIARKAELMKLKDKSRTYYFDLFVHWQAQENNNSIFTSAISIVFAFNKALDHWIKEGYNERVQRYKYLWQYMRCGLQKLDLELIDVPQQHSYIINLIKIPPYMNYELVRNYLFERNYTIYTNKESLNKGRFFIATMGDLNTNQIDQFLFNFKEILQISKNEFNYVAKK